MKAFTFVRPTSIDDAAKAAAVPGSVIKAGGIDLLDRMKERIAEPSRVVSLGDLKEPALRKIEVSADGVRIGALVTLAEIAGSPEIARVCPALAEAAGSAASPQIRARATLGGNLAQHTRCGYYRHGSFPCFKRGDEHCPVLDEGAVQETAAIFVNRPCASAHPSSVAPVLAANAASLHFATTAQELVLPVPSAYYEKPERGRAEDILATAGTALIGVEVPTRRASRSAFEEVRQKTAFDWALVSCCVRLDMDGDKVKDAGVWLGSVAPTPWHAEAAEKALIGKPLTDETIAAAAEAAVLGATPLPGNAYKVDLVKVVVRRALERLRAMK